MISSLPACPDEWTGITPVRTVHPVVTLPSFSDLCAIALDACAKDSDACANASDACAQASASAHVGAHRHTTAKREATFVFLETECVTKDGCLFQLVCL